MGSHSALEYLVIEEYHVVEVDPSVVVEVVRSDADTRVPFDPAHVLVVGNNIVEVEATVPVRIS